MSLASEDFGTLGAMFPSLSEAHGGRPLKPVGSPAGLQSLERHGSLIPTVLQPASKKGRSVVGEMTVDGTAIPLDEIDGDIVVGGE
ncbi:hypothetical protein V6N13_021091 [Hibiscus sabdariffa]